MHQTKEKCQPTKKNLEKGGKYHISVLQTDRQTDASLERVAVLEKNFRVQAINEWRDRRAHPNFWRAKNP